MCTLGKQCVFQDYLWSMEKGLAGAWVTRKPSEKKKTLHTAWTAWTAWMMASP